MKKFFYACAAILCLTMAFHFGATSAQGQASFSLRQLGLGEGGNGIFVECNGDVFALRPGGWSVVTNLPAPPTELSFFNGSYAVSRTGHGYVTWGNGVWNDLGVVPCSPTSTTQTTFGAVKERYR